MMNGESGRISIRALLGAATTVLVAVLLIRLGVEVTRRAKLKAELSSLPQAAGVHNANPQGEKAPAQAIGAGTPREENGKGHPGQRDSADLKLQAFTHRIAMERHAQVEFGSLLKAAGLPREKLVRVNQLIVDRMLALDDARAAAASAGIRAGTKLYAEAMANAAKETDSSLAALLTQDENDSVQAVLKLGPANSLIQSYIAPEMSFANVPLTGAQTVSLAEVMTELHYAREDPLFLKAFSEPVNSTTGMTPLFQKLTTKAASFLSPAQVEILKNQQWEYLASQDIARPLKQ
jgi:hypothetical protein